MDIITKSDSNTILKPFLYKRVRDTRFFLILRTLRNTMQCKLLPIIENNFDCFFSHYWSSITISHKNALWFFTCPIRLEFLFVIANMNHCTWIKSPIIWLIHSSHMNFRNLANLHCCHHSYKFFKILFYQVCLLFLELADILILALLN